MTGEIWSFIVVLTCNSFNGQFVHPFEGDGVKWVDGEIVILALLNILFSLFFATLCMNMFDLVYMLKVTKNCNFSSHLLGMEWWLPFCNLKNLYKYLYYTKT